MSSETIAFIAALVAALSALYARWSFKEARKANDIGRMNALLAFRQHYLQLMEHQTKLSSVLKETDSGMQAIRDKNAELDMKLREISKEIENYHSKVVKNEI